VSTNEICIPRRSVAGYDLREQDWRKLEKSTDRNDDDSGDGSLGKIETSPDAVTRTNWSSGTTETLDAVSENGTRWVAVGGVETSLTSDDAIAWTQQVSGTTQYLYGQGTSSG
jgi:hypothetical protein